MNMKKQFYRVKQLADQTFLKADKTEILDNKELQIADQKIEYLRTAISAIIKRIPSSGQGNDVDKRLKKAVESHLANVFQEQGQRRAEQEEDCQLFQDVLRKCSVIEQNLAKDYADHESKVEEMVGAPLQTLLDTEFPTIQKHKRTLAKYILDKDSANSRLSSANKKDGAKKDSIQDDFDEADSKVEQSRDVFAAEMFSLLAKENELASYILQLLKLQRGYHESALKNLEGIIPELEKQIGDSSTKRVFGISLHEHLRVTGKRIALPLEICITTLRQSGMHEEGLFRIAGSTLRVRRLKNAIDSGCLRHLSPTYEDPHVLASTLKLYLRELPEPLLTFHLHDKWMAAMSNHNTNNNEQQKLEACKILLQKLPQENRDNLTYLMQFLGKLSHIQKTKMNSSNIAIVIAPNLMWNKDKEAKMNMDDCGTVTMLVEFLIKRVDELFPEDLSCLVTLPLYENYREKQNDLLNVNNSRVQVRSTEHIAEFSTSSESVHLTDSPKPNTRKKKPAAPVPPGPGSKLEDGLDRASLSQSYPSGSVTLNRPQKPKEPKLKASVGSNTDDELGMSHRVNNETNLVNIETKTAEHKVVAQPAVPVQVSKAKPVQPVIAQNTNCDKQYKTTATHNVHAIVDEMKQQKPAPVPRSSMTSAEERGGNISRTPSIRNDAMSKSASEVEVALRRPEALDRVHKPEIPARPASLQKRGSIDCHQDPIFQRTQCSLYSVANKQQPSIVNLQNRNERYQPGHDSQILEKERFLGHQPAVVAPSSPPGTTTTTTAAEDNETTETVTPPSTTTAAPITTVVPMPRPSLENRFADINSNNCNNSSKPPKTLRLDKVRSIERLDRTGTLNEDEINNDEDVEKLNGNNRKPSHTRTRSDGNLVDLSEAQQTILQTPPSPRSLSKPTQPPPPPPINVNRTKEADSTDL